MKTVLVINERAKLIPVHDLSEIVVYRCFFDEHAVNVVIEETEELQEAA